MITVIGAGLAGSEAAWYIAQNGADVELVEQKPVRRSPAHMSNDFCELVCSNSLKSDDVFGNACGLLKEEMRRLGSLTMEAAAATRVPAGGALAVDRERFSAYVTEKLRTHPKIHIACREADSLPESGIVATARSRTAPSMKRSRRGSAADCIFTMRRRPSSPRRAWIWLRRSLPTAMAGERGTM